MLFRLPAPVLPCLAAAAVLTADVGAQEPGSAAVPVRPDRANPAEAEKEVSPAVPPETGTETETAGLRQRLVAVGKALAESNRELEVLRAEHERLRLQMEALGIAALKPETRAIQERLLKAAAELHASEKARTNLVERTTRLAEAASAFMAAPGHEGARAALDEAISAAGREAAIVDRAAPAPVVPLEAARVVSCKADLGLVVINAGRESGVRLGAPMRLVRGERAVATGYVIDLRDRIAGVLLTGPPAAVKVGDSVKPELTQPAANK